MLRLLDIALPLALSIFFPLLLWRFLSSQLLCVHYTEIWAHVSLHGDSRILRNVGSYLQIHTTLLPIKPTLAWSVTYFNGWTTGVDSRQSSNLILYTASWMASGPTQSRDLWVPVWGKTSRACCEPLAGTYAGWWHAERGRETVRVKRAAEADWLTGARDFKCAEPSKTRPSSSVAVTYVGGWYTEGDRAYSKRLKLIGWQGHVTLNAQNRPKLGHRRPWRSHMSAGGTQRETELTVSDWSWLADGHVTLNAQNRSKRGRLRMCRSLKCTDQERVELHLQSHHNFMVLI
jgi:hypothetical protein